MSEGHPFEEGYERLDFIIKKERRAFRTVDQRNKIRWLETTTPAPLGYLVPSLRFFIASFICSNPFCVSRINPPTTGTRMPEKTTPWENRVFFRTKRFDFECMLTVDQSPYVSTIE